MWADSRAVFDHVTIIPGDSASVKFERTSHRVLLSVDLTLLTSRKEVAFQIKFQINPQLRGGLRGDAVAVLARIAGARVCLSFSSTEKRDR